MEFISPPEGEVRPEVPGDVDADSLPPAELHHVGHPHGAVRCGGEGPLSQDLLGEPCVVRRVPDQKHRFAVAGRPLGGRCEGDLGVEEEEAVPQAEDGASAVDKVAGLAALRLLPGAVVRSCGDIQKIRGACSRRLKFNATLD